MKKGIYLLLLLFLLSGCGGAKEPAAAPETAKPAEVIESAAPAVPTESVEPPEAAPFIGEAGAPEAEKSEVSFGADMTLTLEGVCELSDLYAEVLDDQAVGEGWYYYYTDSDQSPAETLTWTPSEGNYTTVEVLFTVKNISSEARSYGDRLTAQLLYRESGDAETQSYIGTVFQQNPGQVDENGEIIMWSAKPVEIPVGDSANVSFRFDIPREVYEKVYAEATEGETGITELCRFRFDNGTAVNVDLAEVLIPASAYDWE